MEAEIRPEGYAILVARSQPREGSVSHQGELYEIGLRDPFPVIPVPLKPGAPDIPLDLPGIFRNLYIQARYRLQLDYTRPLNPALPDEGAAWVAVQLSAAFPGG